MVCHDPLQAVVGVEAATRHHLGLVRLDADAEVDDGVDAWVCRDQGHHLGNRVPGLPAGEVDGIVAAPPGWQVLIDVGQEVQVLAWNDNGTARVNYRGTQWDATVASPAEARAQTMYIVDTRGSTLVIASAKS